MPGPKGVEREESMVDHTSESVAKGALAGIAAHYAYLNPRFRRISGKSRYVAAS
jgi:hypothetical protein